MNVLFKANDDVDTDSEEELEDFESHEDGHCINTASALLTYICPVFKTNHGRGRAVVDYFSLRSGRSRVKSEVTPRMFSPRNSIDMNSLVFSPQVS